MEVLRFSLNKVDLTELCFASKRYLEMARKKSEIT